MFEETTEENVDTFLFFRLQDVLFGTPILDAREVIEFIETKPLPDCPKWVKGIVNLRGEVLVVVDLRERMHLKSDKQPLYIVVETEKGPVALAVDSVEAVNDIDPSKIQDRAHIQIKIKNEHFIGVANVGTEMALLINLQRVFSEEELVEISSIRAAV